MSITLKSFHRKTKSGGVLKIVREHYLRRDISCGWISCIRCPKEERACLSDDPRVGLSTNHSAHFVIPDSDVILDQIDIFEDELFGNEVIILQTVLNDVRVRNLKTYTRLRDIIRNEKRAFYVFCNEFHADTFKERNVAEDPNDYVDRLINAAVDWYKKHFKAADFVILSSKASKNRYLFGDYIRGHVKSQQLLDKLKITEDDKMDVGDSNSNVKQIKTEPETVEKDLKFMYPEHVKIDQLLSGVKTGKYFQGKFHVNPSNYLEGSIMTNKGGKDITILIQGRMDMNRALDTDVVAVELRPESEWVSSSDVALEAGDVEEEIENKMNNTKLRPKKPTGKVVGIIQRKRFQQRLTGSLKQKPISSNAIIVTQHLFVAQDSRMPLIRIETRQYETLKDQRIVVVIDSWPRDSKFPRGHYVQALGPIGDFATENESVLLEFDVPHESFTKAVLKCLPPQDFVIPPEEYGKRADFRDLNICSVDPPGCTDIDDALHCRVLDSGDYEIGVHIADVGYFMKENTPLDQEAAKRGTSVYLMNTRIDMIPGHLSSNLCSLMSGVERLTFSVVWVMNPKTAEIKSTTFTKAVIKSKAAMTYAAAQSMVDSDSTDELTQSLKRLNSIAKILKQKRIDAGALVLASASEIKFVEVESETHDNLLQIKAKELLETMSMVEEFMLLANVSVAKKILEDFPEIAVLRKHPQPPATNFEEVRIALRAKGFDIDASSGKSMAESLNKIQDNKNPFMNTLVRMLITRNMTTAVYFCSGSDNNQLSHFGLAADVYTHFTSPIRRYADVMVHRLLAASISAAPLDPSVMNKNKVSDICENINVRHKNAQYASRRSQYLTTISFIKSQPDIICVEAHVFLINANAVEIFVPSMAFQVRYWTREPDWMYDTEKLCQIHLPSKTTLKVFDKIKINLGIIDASNDYRRGKESVDVRIIHPPIDEPLEEKVRKLSPKTKSQKEAKRMKK